MRTAFLIDCQCSRENAPEEEALDQDLMRNSSGRRSRKAEPAVKMTLAGFRALGHVLALDACTVPFAAETIKGLRGSLEGLAGRMSSHEFMGAAAN
jgi:hypothetical protein